MCTTKLTLPDPPTGSAAFSSPALPLALNWGRSHRNATEVVKPRGSSLSDAYHNEPPADFDLASASDGAEEETDLLGRDPASRPPGQRHTVDFFGLCLALPVTQKPCLCMSNALDKRMQCGTGDERRQRKVFVSTVLCFNYINSHVLLVPERCWQ